MAELTRRQFLQLASALGITPALPKNALPAPHDVPEDDPMQESEGIYWTPQGGERERLEVLSFDGFISHDAYPEWIPHRRHAEVELEVIGIPAGVLRSLKEDLPSGQLEMHMKENSIVVEVIIEKYLCNSNLPGDAVTTYLILRSFGEPTVIQHSTES